LAARKNKIKHDQKTKELIRASQLLNRLTQFAKGEIELSAAQVQAARIVIGKEIPDKKAIEHSTDPNKPMKGVLVWGTPG
jgi:hypothetical protein